MWQTTTVLGLVLYASLAMGPSPTPADTEVVRLKVGTELVVDLDRDTFQESVGIRATRVDDGSVVDLRWDQMLPDDVRRIRASFGFLPDEPEPILVPAVRLVLTTGDEFTGLILEQDAETFRFQVSGKVWTLRWAGVRSRETVWVDVLDVYDPEDFYAQKLSEAVPQEPLDHYNLALTCESLQLWNRVQEHLLVVQEMDPEFKASVVADKCKRSALRIEAGADAEILDKAQRLAFRQQYDKALDMLGAFIAERPDSSLLGEFRREESRIQRAREKWLLGAVVGAFLGHIERFAVKTAGDESMAVRDAVRAMEREATDYALEATSRQLDVEVDEVRTIWEQPDRTKASPRVASYGAGTFVLGEERVFQDMDRQDGEEDEKGGTRDGSKSGGGEESVQDRIKRMIEDRKKAAEKAKQNKGNKRAQRAERPQSRIQDVPPNRDEWWVAEKLTAKKHFLLAWWAEQNDHVDIVRAYPRQCVRCAGEGVLKVMARRGENSDNSCPRCKTLRIDRVVRFR